IDISDNAGGIPAEMLDRIFEPFVSSKPPESSTGIGLSVTRRAIHSMGGTIEASNHDDGALVTIRLPTVVQGNCCLKHPLKGPHSSPLLRERAAAIVSREAAGALFYDNGH